MVDPRTNSVHFCDIESEQYSRDEEEEWCRPANVNSAESILGSKFVSLCSVELFCTNIGGGAGASTGISGLCCLSLRSCALNVWKILHRGDIKHGVKGVLRALLKGRARVFPKKENTPFLVRCVLKCFLNGAGLEVNCVLLCRLILV